MQLALESLYAPTIHSDKGTENQTISTPNGISDLDLPISLRKLKKKTMHQTSTKKLCFFFFTTCHSHIEHLFLNLAI